MDEKGTVITVEDLLNGKYRYVEGRPVRRSYIDIERNGMTRLEVLKWCWENISDENSKLTWKDMESAIGAIYVEELKYMNFISSWYDWVDDTYRVNLTWLGKAYCEEMFS